MDEDWKEISHYLLTCLCLIVSLILVATFGIHVAAEPTKCSKVHHL